MVVSVSVADPCDHEVDCELPHYSIMREHQTTFRWPGKRSKCKLQIVVSTACALLSHNLKSKIHELNHHCNAGTIYIFDDSPLLYSP